METKNYKVEEKKSFHYQLHVKGEQKHNLVLSIMMTKLLPGGIYNNDGSISFVAEKVSNLEEMLRNSRMCQNICVKMIYCILRQLEELNKCPTKLGFYGVDLSDILIINEDIFVIASASYLRYILSDNLVFYSPFHMPMFSSPEVLSIKSLPGEVHYKCFYYSLGKLCMHCLFNDKEKEKEKDKDKDVLETISYTKMYWFLKRCLASDPNERSLLFM